MYMYLLTLDLCSYLGETSVDQCRRLVNPGDAATLANFYVADVRFSSPVWRAFFKKPEYLV